MTHLRRENGEEDAWTVDYFGVGNIRVFMNGRSLHYYIIANELWYDVELGTKPAFLHYLNTMRWLSELT